MKILGIDPGTIKTGWGLVEYEDGAFGQPLSGVISAPGGWRRSRRLHEIYNELCNLIYKHAPEVVAIETPFVGKNPQTALAIGQGLAAAMIAGESYAVDLAFYSPSEVKLAATGHGRSDKDQVAAFVVATLDLPSAHSIPIDATDALAVAICHANRLSESELLQSRVDRP